jgi:hypothetical protein
MVCWRIQALEASGWIEMHIITSDSMGKEEKKTELRF